jgi:hypothetical protein
MHTAGSNMVAPADAFFVLRTTPQHLLPILSNATLDAATSTYKGSLQLTKSGNASIAVLYQGSALAGWPKEVAVQPAAVSASNSVLQSLPVQVTGGDGLILEVEARDAYENLVCHDMPCATSGGA